MVADNKIGISSSGDTPLAFTANDLRNQSPRLFGGTLSQFTARFLLAGDTGVASFTMGGTTPFQVQADGAAFAATGCPAQKDL